MFSIPTIALRVSVPIGAVWNTWLLGCSLCNKTGNSQGHLSLVLHTEFYGGRGVGDYYNFKILKNFLVISVWIYWDDLWLARFFLLHYIIISPNPCVDTQTTNKSMDPQTSNICLKLSKIPLHKCFDNAKLIWNDWRQSNATIMPNQLVIKYVPTNKQTNKQLTW